MSIPQDEYSSHLKKQLEVIYSCAPGPHEIRIFGQKYQIIFDGHPRNYYHDRGFSIGTPKTIPEAIALLNGHFYNGVSPNNCYIVLNRVSDNYQISTKRGKIGDTWYPAMGYFLTKETDIRGYCALILDLDRAEKTNQGGEKQMASESELEHLKRVLDRILTFLVQFGLSPNYCIMSGNGYQIIFFFEVQDDIKGTKAIIKDILEGLHEKFLEYKVDIDTSLYDPPQTVRLAGTWNEKQWKVIPEENRVARQACLVGETSLDLNGFVNIKKLAETLEPLAKQFGEKRKTKKKKKPAKQEKSRNYQEKKNQEYSHTNWITEQLCSGGEKLLIQALEEVHKSVTLSGESNGKPQLLCPYHDDHTPSAWICENSNCVPMIHCQMDTCDLKGNSKTALGVLMDDGWNFRDACQELFGTLPPNNCIHCGQEIIFQGEGRQPLNSDKTPHACKEYKKQRKHREEQIFMPDKVGFIEEIQSHKEMGQTFPPVCLDEKLRPLDRGFIMKCLQEQDYGDAQMLARLYKHRLIYDHTEKAWYMWSEHIWHKDETNFVKQVLARQIASQYLYLAAEVNQEEAGNPKLLIKRAEKLRKHRQNQGVLDFASSVLGITSERWDKNPWLLAVKNGVLDIRTGELRPGSPEDYIKAKSPVEWRGIDEPAPQWKQFLRQVMADNTEHIKFLQRLLGYGITGLTTEHIFPIFFGIGRNGKDTLLETLGDILGKIANPVSTQVACASSRRGGAAEPHLYDLYGKRLTWACETNEGFSINTAQIKLITGGGTIKTRQLYHNMIDFKPTHLFILVTNHKPHAPSNDYAFWERVLLIPFTQSFVDNPTKPHEHKKNSEIKLILEQETSGILAWLVRGCSEWNEHGLCPPDSIRIATKEYQREENPLTEFFNSCCELDPEKKVKASELYHKYLRFTKFTGIKTISWIEFGKLMVEQFERKRYTDGNYYLGIGLKEIL